MKNVWDLISLLFKERVGLYNLVVITSKSISLLWMRGKNYALRSLQHIKHSFTFISTFMSYILTYSVQFPRWMPLRFGHGWSLLCH